MTMRTLLLILLLFAPACLAQPPDADSETSVYVPTVTELATELAAQRDRIEQLEARVQRLEHPPQRHKRHRK